MLKMSSITGAFAVAMLVGGLASAPAMANSSSSSDATMSMSGKKHHHSPAEMAAQVENRIETLHAKLKITPDQESAWNDVAQTMRDNEQSMSQLIQDRHANASTMSALDDLNSYQKIAENHAESISKLSSSFEPLYDEMSDSQKKNADEVFGRFEGHRGMEKASMKKGQKAPSTDSSNE